MGPFPRRVAARSILHWAALVPLGFGACQFPAFEFEATDAGNGAGQAGSGVGGLGSDGGEAGAPSGAGAGADGPGGDGGGPGGSDAGGAGGAPSEPCTVGVPSSATCEVYAEHEYYFFLDPETFAVAETRCTSLDMALVVIDDLFEDEWLQQTALALGNDWYWAGGSDRALETTWVWSNGVEFWQGYADGTAIDGAYTNWNTGDPDGSGSCLLVFGGIWDDYDCGESFNYVCERP